MHFRLVPHRAHAFPFGAIKLIVIKRNYEVVESPDELLRSYSGAYFLRTRIRYEAIPASSTIQIACMGAA